MTKKAYNKNDQILGTASGPRKTGWSTAILTDAKTLPAYSYTLKSVPCFFHEPSQAPCNMQLTFITEVLIVTSLPCRIVRRNSQEGD